MGDRYEQGGGGGGHNRRGYDRSGGGGGYRRDQGGDGGGNQQHQRSFVGRKRGRENETPTDPKAMLITKLMALGDRQMVGAMRMAGAVGSELLRHVVVCMVHAMPCACSLCEWDSSGMFACSLAKADQGQQDSCPGRQSGGAATPCSSHRHMAWSHSH